jgi:hypothetical protein
MKKIFLVLISLFVVMEAQNSILAATIPAGTTLNLRLMDMVTSHDRVGKTFKAKLDQDVAVKGNVLLRAGTVFHGVVEASRADPRRSNPLSVNLTDVLIHGRKVSVKTTSGFHPSAPATTQRQRLHGFTAGEETFSPGARLPFRLAEPLNI